MDIEKLKAQTRQLLGDEADLSYIDSNYIESMQAAENVDDDFKNREKLTRNGFYGRDVSQYGTTTYWYAENKSDNESDACGGYAFSSEYVRGVEWSGVCVAGGSYYFLSLYDGSID